MIIITNDGMPQLHRVFPKKPRERRGPVLLMHGFLGTSADFILSGPNVALAYQLLNDGYHVFLANCRGSKFAMKHKALDPLSREFWRFSFDEIGLLDLPAIINYALFLTERKSLFYIGHNQGASALLALLSSRPRFNEKIIQAHFLAPIAFMDYPHPVLAFSLKDYEESVRALKSYNFISMSDFTKTVVDNYCAESIPGGLRYCVRLWEFLFGRNQIDTEIDPKVLLDLPTFVSPTASVRQLMHFLQLFRSGKFQSYASRDAPPLEYKLTNVQIPVYIYHAAEDLIVSRVVCDAFNHLSHSLCYLSLFQDVERLRNILAPVVKVYKIVPNFNHYDLLLSKNGKALLYDDICRAITNDGLDFFGYVKTIFA
jgi:pimeloyl-ACP methyl ester carboxylesterase